MSERLMTRRLPDHRQHDLVPAGKGCCRGSEHEQFHREPRARSEIDRGAGGHTPTITFVCALAGTATTAVYPKSHRHR
jgi:hypothetical protein